jgi:uncharacterized protein (TIGR03437 family)
MALPHAFAQTGPTLVGLSNYVPGLPTVAPGQIVNFNVTGLKTVLSNGVPVVADHTPLPTVLAGISATLHQSAPDGGVASLPVPLIAVWQVNRCSVVDVTAFITSADCYITLIKGQIPFEMAVLPGGLPPTDVEISENGVNSQRFTVLTTFESLHINTFFDSVQCHSDLGVCVTHADGSLVTIESPAVPGEVVVVYAYGLGKTNPVVPTGQPTPTPAPVVTTLPYIQFDFTPNAPPRRPTILTAQSPGVSLPEFAGLTPGQVGLYQINVKLPATFPAVAACDVSSVGRLFTIYSNLTINISFNDGLSDGVPICVKPGQ